MAGTNDSIVKSADEILDEILQLKLFIEETLPECEVIISCPTCRYDDQTAKLTVIQLRQKLQNLNFPIIMNDNIFDMHIGKKGLHLNQHGSGRLAVNFMSHMRHN